MKESERNIVSLFDGISTLQHALNAKNIQFTNYYASEVDKHAIFITNKNYPDTIQLGDVSMFDSCIDNVFLLAGGSPCQNLSIANTNREGINGTKSNLFFEYVRILNNLKPKYFLYENVASMSIEDRDIISKNLGCQPYEINSKIFGVQDRKRYYWTNIKIDNYKDLSNTICVNDIVDTITSDNTIHKKYEDQIVITNLNNRMIGYIKNKNRGNRIYNPNYKAITITANSGGIGRNTGLYLIDNVVRRLSPIETEATQGLPQNYTSCVSNNQRYHQLGNGWNSDTIQFILNNLI